MAIIHTFKALCFYVTLITFIVPFTAAAEFAGGTGEPNDPYQIATAEQLISIGSEPNLLDKHFVLVSDINLDPNLPGGKVFNEAVVVPQFMGILDGKGHTLTNLTMELNFIREMPGYVSSFGLFRDIGPNAQIRNLGLENVHITGDGHIGALAGSNDGMITNCYVVCEVTGDGSGLLGGLAGHNRGTIFECHATCIVSDGDRNGYYLGGLVGWNAGTIINCYATGRVYGGKFSRRVGGLVANNDGGTITNSYATAAVKGQEYVGGLVGVNEGTITNCYATGSVSGREWSKSAGGLVGFNSGMITNCYATGSVSGDYHTKYLGGLAGGISPTKVKGCYFLAPPDGTRLNNGLGSPLTDEQMKQQGSFAGWDFESVWTIREGEDYPKLQPDAPASLPSPPDLSNCTRVEIQYFPSTLEHFLSYVNADNLLSPKELQYLQSLKKIVVENQESIEVLAQDISSGSYDTIPRRMIRAVTPVRVDCYCGDEQLTTFTVYGLHIAVQERQLFRYSKNLIATLHTLTPQLQPFKLRAQCARRLQELYSRLRSYLENRRDWKQYPEAFQWCDEIVRTDQAWQGGEESIMRLFKCPGAGEGKCHNAMNPNCPPNSPPPLFREDNGFPPDIVLLFETKAGWNQHGGPELFTFDNHDPRGGCVLLNDGTVKFIRTEEELHSLRWK